MVMELQSLKHDEQGPKAAVDLRVTMPTTFAIVDDVEMAEAAALSPRQSESSSSSNSLGSSSSVNPLVARTIESCLSASIGDRQGDDNDDDADMPLVVEASPAAVAVEQEQYLQVHRGEPLEQATAMSLSSPDASIHAQNIVAAAMMLSFEQHRGIAPPADPVCEAAAAAAAASPVTGQLQEQQQQQQSALDESLLIRSAEESEAVLVAQHSMEIDADGTTAAATATDTSVARTDRVKAGMVVVREEEEPIRAVQDKSAPTLDAAVAVLHIEQGQTPLSSSSIEALSEAMEEEGEEEGHRPYSHLGPNHDHDEESHQPSATREFKPSRKRNTSSGGKRLQLKRSSSSSPTHGNTTMMASGSSSRKKNLRQLGSQAEASQSTDAVHLIGTGGGQLLLDQDACGMGAEADIDAAVSMHDDGVIQAGEAGSSLTATNNMTATTKTEAIATKKGSTRRKSKELLGASKAASSPPKVEMKEIPQFYFPMGRPIASSKRLQKALAKELFMMSPTQALMEDGFVSITVQCCELPRYMNRALFRKCEVLSALRASSSSPLSRSPPPASSLASSRSATPTPGQPSSVSLQQPLPQTSTPPQQRHQQQQQRALEGVRYEDFEAIWQSLVETCPDEVSMIFQILKQPQNAAFLTPADFEVVLQDLVLFHPGLEFLSGNAVFQERYLETVITRIFYEANRRHGRMTLADLRKAEFDKTLRKLENSDLNQTDDCFSYKHFYVIYCKFWELDQDHDLILDEHDLAGYASGAISSRIIRRVMQGYGNEMGMFIVPDPALQRQQQQQQQAMMGVGSMANLNTIVALQQQAQAGVGTAMEVETSEEAQAALAATESATATPSPTSPPPDIQAVPLVPATATTMMTAPRTMRPGPGIQVRPQQYRMTYKGFIWFLLAETDKQTPTSIEYWFRCMDLDGDGVLSVFELEQLFQEQATRMAILGMESFVFRDAVCQMQDLVSPQQTGLVRLADLKHCGQAGPFIDLFCNVVRWRSFEAHQHQIRMRQQQIAMQRAADAAWEEAGGGASGEGGMLRDFEDEDLSDDDDEDDDDEDGDEEDDDDEDDSDDDDTDMSDEEGLQVGRVSGDDESGDESSDDDDDDDHDSNYANDAQTAALLQDQSGHALAHHYRRPSIEDDEDDEEHSDGDGVEVDDDDDDPMAGYVGLGVEMVQKVGIVDAQSQRLRLRLENQHSPTTLADRLQSTGSSVDEDDDDDDDVEEQGQGQLMGSVALTKEQRDQRKRRRRRRRRRMSLARRAELEELRKERALLATIRESPWIVYVEAEYEKLVTIERPQSRTNWGQGEEEEEEEGEEEGDEGEEHEDDQDDEDDHEHVQHQHLHQHQHQQQQQLQHQLQQQQRQQVFAQQQQQQLQQVWLMQQRQQQQQYVLQQQLQLQQQFQLQQQQQVQEMQSQMENEAKAAGAAGGMMVMSASSETTAASCGPDDFEQIPMDVD
ncbi:Serine/threonine-protein phosphatase 2A regulatory subunit B'' subunit alpha [Actinomortierella ambigua]|nr:Serine/threonine-protein phosphatase 2A regulatory subunit B'' subunit alpha [Actinomortierella ambigua]